MLAPDSEVHLARLRAYTTAVTTPELLDRSPFEFAFPPQLVAAPPRQAVRQSEDPTTPPATVESPVPLPALVGIAEQNEAGALVRTAIFTTPDGAVSFALIGQTAGTFRVTSIESNRVVLVDSRGGGTSTVVLK